jgi:hypothetical protein
MAGLFAGLGFLTYNGYWQFGATVLVLASFTRRGSLAEFRDYVGLGVAGLATPIAAVLIVGKLLGHDLIRSYVDFSRTVTSGDFGTAWKLYAQYFWATEHSILIFWVFAFILAVASFLRGALDARVKLWIGGILMLYAVLVIPSDLFESIAVEARHGRPLAIFFSLIGGWCLSRCWQSAGAPKIGAMAVCLLLFIQAAANLGIPLRQEFPKDFRVRAMEIVRQEEEREGGRYRILNDDLLDGPSSIQECTPSLVVVRSPHPQQYEPYLFDAWNSAFRKIFLERDISMRVVRVLPEDPQGLPQISRSAGDWKPYIGAVRLDIIFDPHQGNHAQPLVSSGAKGAGDQVFVERLGPNLLRLGFDHWSRAGTYSDPISCDLSKRHVVIVSYGSLYPDGSYGRFNHEPSYHYLKNTVLVKFDGKTVIDVERNCYPAIPSSIFLFHNFIGFSSSDEDFSGRVFSESPTDIRPDILGLREKS